MRDRRFEPRHTANDPVEVSWPGGTGSGILRDYSRSGARIEMEHPVKVGTEAHIKVRGLELAGQIRSCVRTQTAAHLLGIEFDPEFQGKIRRNS